ncbi:MAG: hypothetical protein FWE06_02835 [Oscillospiraceae bacterium]|nr:hypothetical protein [Oscillospiraceae bacterium]
MKKQTNIFWGLIAIAAAALIIINIVVQPLPMSPLSIVLTVLLGVGFIYKAIRREWGSAFFFAGWLTWLYREPIYNATDVRLSIWTIFGVMLLLSIGFRMLFGKRKHTFFDIAGVNISFDADETGDKDEIIIEAEED